MNLRQAVYALIKSFDDEQGLPNETYLAACNLVELVYGTEAMQEFCDSMDCTEDRHYLGQGMGETIAERIVDYAGDAHTTIVTLVSNMGEFQGYAEVDPSFTINSKELAKLEQTAEYYSQRVRLDSSRDFLENAAEIESWIRETNGDGIEDGDFELPKRCEDCGWEGNSSELVTKMLDNPHNSADDTLCEVPCCPECGSNDIHNG